jgi:hypothetical protein
MPTKDTSKDSLRAQQVYSNDQIVSSATGHWGEIAQQVKPAEPYVIKVPDSDETIVVPVLTRFRRKALKASQATYLMMGGQLAEVAKEGSPDQATITRIQGLIEQAESAYDRALFGDVYERVIEFFDPLPEEWWDAMYQAVHDQLVNRAVVPEDTCPRCGQSTAQDDPEGGEPGKEQSSSTSVTDIGKKRKETSGSTSA